MIFRNRREAGRRLGRRLGRMRLDGPVVVGLARGGMPVASEVAAALGAVIDVLVVRKLGCPWYRELGVGALGENGVRVLNTPLLTSLGLTVDELAGVVEREREEIVRQVRLYHGQRRPVELAGRCVVLVDDGIATGFSVRAGVEVVRRRGAAQIVVAAPVASRTAVDDLAGVTDRVVCLFVPETFLAVGEFYDDYAPTSDDEVLAALSDQDAA